MTKEQVSKYFSRLGKAGMAKRWKGTTKEERVKAVQAAVRARQAQAVRRNSEWDRSQAVTAARLEKKAAKRNGGGK